ncbi:MAG: hypothetical protein JOZ78_06980, partial [Chroococcidiopsidaceae cyanobacterium CP_BM_ER_R8_30]|nr:hypothetical protein [Chroococcidiopsidaceae cyanobacterium CP_BM_ER_R8_30]
MASSAAYDREYQQAQKAYIQGNYKEAEQLVDRLVQKFPEDPSSRLLKGHIYCVLQRYDVAREQYQAVLSLTENPEVLDYAHKGLETVGQYESYDHSAHSAAIKQPPVDEPAFNAVSSEQAGGQPELEDLAMLDNFDPTSLDFNSFSRKHEHETELELTPHHDPLESSTTISPAERMTEATGSDAFANPFTSDWSQPQANLGKNPHSNPFDSHVEQAPGEMFWNRTEEQELG